MEEEKRTNELLTFAAKTRHKPSEYKMVGAYQHILKKLLATQSPNKLVEWKKVYNYVSNDIDRINFRSPGVLEQYSQQVTLPLHVFTNIFKYVEYQPKKCHLLDDFVEKVNPPAGSEHALFFANNSYQRSDFMDELSQLWCDDDHAKTDALYDKLVSYRFDGPNAARQLGEMIAGFVFNPNVGLIVVEEEEKEECIEDSTIITASDNNVEFAPAIKKQEWTPDVERMFRQNVDVIQMKQSFDLPTQYPSLEIVNKLLAQNSSKEFIKVVDYYPNMLIDKISETPQAKEFFETKFYNTKEDTKTKRDFVKEMFNDAETISNDIVRLIKQL